MLQLTSDLLNGLAEKMFKLYEEKQDPNAIDTISSSWWVAGS